MGDRAVIGFKANRESVPVFLYSHWGGSDRYRDLQRALVASRSRWNDPDYATRIATSQIIGNYWIEETGFGISAGENSFSKPDYDDVPVVIWDEQLVVVVNAEDSTTIRTPEMAFHEFLALADC